MIALHAGPSSAKGIPCGMVRHAGEAAALAGEGALLDIRIDGIPRSGKAAIPNAGFRMKPSGPETDKAPPRLDQDREEILAWLAEPWPNGQDRREHANNRRSSVR